MENYENIVNILKQLDIGNINITETMFNELNKFLNNQKYINNYYIKNIIDLDNTEIINFYYLLFKYILKNPIYIYHIKFLFQIRKNIITNIQKSNEKCQANFKNKEQKEYVIRFLLDSEYYYLKYNSNNNNNNIQDNSNQLSTVLKNTKQDNISENNEIDEKNLNENDFELFMMKILYKSSFLLKRNNYGQFVFSILNDEKKMRIIKEERKILEINFKKFLEFLSIVKEIIEKQFIYKYNLIIKLDFFIDEYHKNSDSCIFFMICNYSFYPPNSDRISSFRDENV